MKYRLSIFLIFLVLFNYESFAQSEAITYGTLTDPRDNKSYKTLVLGEQEWMAENLNFNIEGNSWCYENIDSLCNIYGRFYNWEAALNSCPDGWRLPSDDDWKVLEKYLGVPDSSLNVLGYLGPDAGAQLKAGGSSGFEVLMTGYYWKRWATGFFYKDHYANFWTSTEADKDCAYFRDFSINDPTVFRNSQFKSMGFSIRCIKN